MKYSANSHKIEHMEDLIDLMTDKFRYRFHFFIKGFEGIWACINRECEFVNQKYRDQSRLIGKLYSEPRTRCECGSKTLKLHYCFDCGETAFSGNVIDSRDDGDVSFLLSSRELNENSNLNNTKFFGLS